MTMVMKAGGASTIESGMQNFASGRQRIGCQERDLACHKWEEEEGDGESL